MGLDCSATTQATQGNRTVKLSTTCYRREYHVVVPPTEAHELERFQQSGERQSTNHLMPARENALS